MAIHRHAVRVHSPASVSEGPPPMPLHLDPVFFPKGGRLAGRLARAHKSLFDLGELPTAIVRGKRFPEELKPIFAQWAFLDPYVSVTPTPGDCASEDARPTPLARSLELLVVAERDGDPDAAIVHPAWNEAHREPEARRNQVCNLAHRAVRWHSSTLSGAPKPNEAVQ